jgi:hypothetical protein
MKIVDIVSESTNEGLGNVLASAGAWMLGKGSRAQSVEKLADAMAAVGTKISAKDAEKLVGKELARDAKVMADAEHLAIKKIADAKYAANVAAIKAQWKAAGEAIESFRTWTMYPAIGIMFAAPLLVYYNNMQRAQKLLDAQKLSLSDFEKWHQQQMAALIGKWAAIFTGMTLAKVPAAAIAWVFRKLGATVLAKIITSYLGTGSAIAVMAAINHPTAAQHIAEFMAGNIFGQTAGYLGVKGEDALLGWFSSKLPYGNNQVTNQPVNGQGSKQDTKQDPNAATDIGASSQPPSGSGSTSSNKIASEFDRPLFKDFK